MLELLADEYHRLIEAFLATTGMSPEMAHINIGLGLYVLAQIAFRDRRGTYRAFAVVVLAELFNELMDAIHFGSLRLEDTAADLALTFAWPLILIATGTYRRRRWERHAIILQRQIDSNPLVRMSRQAA